MKHAAPVVETAKRLAPVRLGYLRKSIRAQTKRPRGYKAPAARAFAYTRAMGGTVSEARAASAAVGTAPVIVFIGPGRNPQALFMEFGTSHNPPQPYLRPAWDQHKGTMLKGIGADMWAEIDKAAKRLAKKRSKR